MTKRAKFMFTVAVGAVLLLAGQLQQEAKAYVPWWIIRIENAYTHQLLDVPDASTLPGTWIQQYPANGSNGSRNQHWQLDGRCSDLSFLTTETLDCDGYVAIINFNSNLVLDVPGLSNDSGVLIQQYSYNGGKNQQWLLVPVGRIAGRDAYKILNHNSRKYLEVPPPYTTGTRIIQNDFNNNLSQVWFLGYAGSK